MSEQASKHASKQASKQASEPSEPSELIDNNILFI
jgi:hypothetical protein